MPDPIVTRAALLAEAELEPRQVLSMVEVWQNESRGRYFAFVKTDENGNGHLHELGGRDFEEAAQELQDALLFKELFGLLPRATQTKFAPVIRRHFRRALRRKGLTVDQVVGQGVGSARIETGA